MKEVTKLLIEEFELKRLGIDFMGYRLQKNDIFTFHHLLIPNRNKGPMERWNGAILCGLTSHPYLHLIEAKEYEIFNYITSEMVDMNIKGYLARENLLAIRELLEYFEDKYKNVAGKKGKPIIRREYLERPNIDEVMTRVRKK